MQCGSNNRVIIAAAVLLSVSVGPLAQAQTSSISVSFTVNLPQICQQLSGLVPNTISENPGRQCLQWGVYKGPPATCTGNGNTLQVQAEISYRAGQRCGVLGVGQASCGFDSDPIKHARIQLSSPITWNSNYSVNAQPTASFNLVDPCNVTIANIDMRSFIQSKAQRVINNLNNSLPGIVARSTNFQPKAAQLWSELLKPVKILQNPSLWLSIHPRALTASAPKIVDNNVVLTMALQADPQIIESQTSPAPDVQPLPPLRVGP